MFNQTLYLMEMTEMVDNTIKRLQIERPTFKIYTTSIWTDPDAAVSSINFDSKENSLKKVAESNNWNKKYYDQYLAEGDIEQAELFKPNQYTRICNPADFELRDFEQVSHQSFSEGWESETEGECWTEIEPALIEIGNYAFSKIKELNIEDGFELAINSNEDWYDKTWPLP
ncbi:hypothetical protein [Mucilaginibacter sp.]|uniref:hypothetical protein n=2 Tax=Mucilaginibacter sp. TaxID=1882438 RepID=UPI00374D15EF